MKLASRAFVLSAALVFVGATVAAACPGADAAKASNASTASKSGCGAKATQASTSTGEAAKVTAVGGSSGCGAKATTAAHAGCAKDKAGCAKGAGNSACCPKGAVATQAKAGAKVSLEGTVHCAHCDLKTAESCSTILKTADGRLVTLTDGPQVQTLRQEAGHGSKIVKVKGVVGENGYVSVNSFKLVADAPVATTAQGM